MQSVQSMSTWMQDNNFDQKPIFESRNLVF